VDREEAVADSNDGGDFVDWARTAAALAVVLWAGQGQQQGGGDEVECGVGAEVARQLAVVRWI
jgi:hypothetical protein